MVAYSIAEKTILQHAVSLQYTTLLDFFNLYLIVHLIKKIKIILYFTIICFINKKNQTQLIILYI
jgi:hypothetical protein